VTPALGLLLGLAALAAGCAGGAPESRAPAGDYLRYVGFDLPFGENVLLHWSRRQMPLRVHLPQPPEGFYADPVAVHEVVRDGVTNWADAAGPGLPSFTFVETPADADIQIVWAFEAPDPSWYIAYCVYSPTINSKQFAVDQILVTARWRGAEPALDLIYGTMLHEVGHALGLAGHSPDPNDVMGRGARPGRVLTERDSATLRALYARPNGHRVTGPKRVD
jgi:predicted Zn-dependent protease